MTESLMIDRQLLAPSATGAASTATLPEWNLDDLYPAMDAPEIAADLDRGAALARAFQTRWRGALGREAALPGGGGLAGALKEFEALEGILGRLISYAGLVYSSDTSDPARAKFYGDIQAKVTDISSRLLFFPLEMNRLDDAVLDAAMAANPALAHYRPRIVDLRKDKP